jgi:hypothetical protein
MRHRTVALLAIAVALLFLSSLAAQEPGRCMARPGHEPFGPQYSEWSTPTEVEGVNTTALEFPNGLSRDGLSLYYQRAEATGEDLFVVHRPDLDSPWGSPVRLPDGVNSSANDRAAFVSPDGHWLFLASNRPGGAGDYDLYMSWRAHVHDDGAWEEPVNMTALNTSGFESGPAMSGDWRFGEAELFYVSNPGPGGQAYADIYVVTLNRHGAVGIPSVVSELNSSASEGRPYLSRDGRVIYFQSNRPGGVGGFDIWMSRRDRPDEPWSPPENVTELNTADGDLTPVLSWDGLEMFMGTNRPGHVGDIFVSVREKLHGGRGR